MISPLDKMTAQYLLPVVQTLSVLLPPVPGMIIAEYFIVKKSKENKVINWVAIVSWAIGTAVGRIALTYSFFIPAIVSMAATFVLYILMSKLFDKD